jgi:hypothetical protein
MELRIREVDFKAGARSKGSNGGVAVGLPHRNSSVLKQTPNNQREEKEKKNEKPLSCKGASSSLHHAYLHLYLHFGLPKKCNHRVHLRL